MTIPRLPDRDAAQVDALVADRYLDALLAAAERRADDAPADAALAPDVRHAARVLRRSLVRVHPSFRFEERLASRLADLAAAQSGSALAASGGGTMIRFPLDTAGPAAAGPAAEDPLLGAILRGDLDPTDPAATGRAAAGPVDRRPILVGGAAITSAAISIVGVAFVAWRASRPDARPRHGVMGRAARSAHARRAAALAGAGLGGHA
ncbi:MAG: hypothetical protein QG587_828 [Chloroflexota bacterium]|nr:hypothetical protein [Chloroflexota bacterium]